MQTEEEFHHQFERVEGIARRLDASAKQKIFLSRFARKPHPAPLSGSRSLPSLFIFAYVDREAVNSLFVFDKDFFGMSGLLIFLFTHFGTGPVFHCS